MNRIFETNHELDYLADLDPLHYIKNQKLQHTLAEEILEELNIAQGAEILDVGCGDGSLTKKIALLAKNGKVTGLDASKSMIAYAKENSCSGVFPNLDFIYGKVEDTSLEKKFDLIVSFSCFHWVRDAETAIRNLSKALKPGGQLVLLTYPKESKYYEFMQTALLKFPKYAKKSAYNTMFSAQQYEDALQKNGLKIQFKQVKDLTTANENIEEIKDFIQGWLVNFVELPEEFHEEYLDEVLSNCQKYITYGKSGQIHLPYTEIIIKSANI